MPLLEAEVITINVHALGPSGSGKTVFMAAMYPQLRIKRGEADFYLKTDHATSVHMNSVFNAVPNPQEEWSASTRVASEWEFGLTVLTPADDFGPLKMRYLDYPGLILTAPRAAEDERYRQVIEQLKSATPAARGAVWAVTEPITSAGSEACRTDDASRKSRWDCIGNVVLTCGNANVVLTCGNGNVVLTCGNGNVVLTCGKRINRRWLAPIWAPGARRDFEKSRGPYWIRTSDFFRCQGTLSAALAFVSRQ